MGEVKEENAELCAKTTRMEEITEGLMNGGFPEKEAKQFEQILDALAESGCEFRVRVAAVKRMSDDDGRE